MTQNPALAGAEAALRRRAGDGWTPSGPPPTAALQRTLDELRAYGQALRPPDEGLLRWLEHLLLGDRTGNYGGLALAQAAGWPALLRAPPTGDLGTEALRLLVQLRHFDGHDPLSLLRSPLLLPPPPHDAGVEVAGLQALTLADATDVPLHSIDAQDPHEIDDALFAEPDGDATLLTVAIALPGRWMPVGCPADQAACARGAALYHPRHHAPLLDPVAIAERGSLRAGERREALLFRLRVEGDGGLAVLAVGPAWVRVRANLSFQDANAALAGEAPGWLREAFAATQRSERNRIARGAYLLYRDDVDLRAPSFGVPWLEPAPQVAPGRRVVSEAMVLAGVAAARLCAERRLAVPFRHQALGRRPSLPPGLYHEPADVHGALRCMGSGGADTAPRAHVQLGVDGYVQIGSPLRRYGDLLAQQQLLAVLAGKAPPRNAAGVTEAIARSAERRQKLRAAERQGRRTFGLLRLCHEPAGQTQRAQIIEAKGSSCRALMPDWAQEVELPPRCGSVGAWLRVRVGEIDVASGRVLAVPA